MEQAVEDPIESARKDWLVGGGRRRKEIALAGDCWKEGGGEGVAGQGGRLGCLAGGRGWFHTFPLVSSCCRREACWWTCSVTRC